MREESSLFDGRGASLEVRYTDKPVSGWGGLVAVVRYMDRLGVRELLKRGLADGRSSPNQIPVVDIALGFMVAVLSGARRFAHAERLRADELVRGIVGVKRMPSAMTLTRYFGGLVRSQVEHLSAVLWQFSARQLRAPALGACWIWTPPSWSATGIKRAVLRVIIHANTVVPRIIRCWRCWPRPKWWCMPGCAAATAPARGV